MARKTRWLPPSVAFHVCNRAAGKICLFPTSADYLLFESTLAEMLEKFPIQLFAFSLMPNHYHLFLESTEFGELSRGLHWLDTTHAIRWRKQTGTRGRGALYQNCFRAHAVQKNEAFLRVAHYIERNPIAAHLCQSIEEWRWSSTWSEITNRIPLAKWPITKPASWLSSLRNPPKKEWIQRILFSENSGQALGQPGWYQSLNSAQTSKV